MSGETGLGPLEEKAATRGVSISFQVSLAKIVPIGSLKRADNYIQCMVNLSKRGYYYGDIVI